MSKHLLWSLEFTTSSNLVPNIKKFTIQSLNLFKFLMIWQPEVHVEEEGQDEQEEVAKSAAK